MTGRDIVESEVWKDTMARLEKNIFEDFKRTQPNDSDRLEMQSYRMKMLKELQIELQRNLLQFSPNIARKR